MTVLCNIIDCGYNSDGMCMHDEYLKIKNGQCEWLTTSQNYRVRGNKTEVDDSNIKKVEDKALDTEEKM